jgi:thymidylate kinase
MIVLEGPDGSGKTTLAEELCREFGLKYTRAPHLSSETGPTDGDAIVEWWERQLKLKKKDKIYDRTFYISEPIYQMAQGKRDLIVDNKRYDAGFFKFTNKVDLLVFCLPPWETTRQTLSDDNRLALEGVDVHMLRKVHWLYGVMASHWMEILFERVSVYDYTSMTNQHIKEAVGELVAAAV